MDADRFDILTRTVSTPGSRRRALVALSGVLGLALGASPPQDARAKKKRCPPCKKRKKGKCKKKLPDGTTCAGGTCQSGACTPATVSPPPPADPCAGVSCGAVPHGETTCSNGFCVITACDAGFRACNDNPTDGCECQTPGCCRDGACQTVHSNGVGQSFNDCVALNTYNQVQAEKAAAAYAAAGNPGTTTHTADSSTACPQVIGSICHQAAICACWAYSGAAAGRASQSGSSFCSCPTTTSPQWT